MNLYYGWQLANGNAQASRAHFEVKSRFFFKSADGSLLYNQNMIKISKDNSILQY